MPVIKIASAWWGIFLSEITPCRYANPVPKSPKLSIQGPILESITLKSAASPMANELIIASVTSQRVAKNTVKISSKSGVILILVTPIVSIKLA